MNRRIGPVISLLYLLATLSIPEPGYASDQPGIAVGDKAPDFTLKDQSGSERRLEDWTRQGKVALVFYRSADW